MCIQNKVMTAIPPLQQVSAALLGCQTGGGHHASIAAPFRDHRDATSGGGWMLSFYSEGGKELSVSARHPEHLHSACGSGAALLLWTLRKKKKKKIKNSPHRPNQSSRAPGRPLPAFASAGTWEFTGEGRAGLRVIMATVGTPASDEDSNLCRSL